LLQHATHIIDVQL